MGKSQQVILCSPELLHLLSVLAGLGLQFEIAKHLLLGDVVERVVDGGVACVTRRRGKRFGQ